MKVQVFMMLSLLLTYSSRARITRSSKSSFDSEDKCLLLPTIVGITDLDLSKREANDCNRKAKNASDASTLMGSKVLQK